MDTIAFLKTVITTPEGWLDLLVGPPDGSGWHDEWFEWPRQAADIIDRAEVAAPNNNVYFSSHLYEAKRSTKDNVLPSRTLQVDLDDAMVPSINPPTVLVETSPGRHQGYWILREAPLSTEALELMSRQLTYSIPDADRSGWSLGHKMRLPDTLNHKYSTGPKLVKVISAAQTLYRDLRLGPVHLLDAQSAADPDQWVPDLSGLPGPRALWAEVRKSLPRQLASRYDQRQEDRSAYLWALELALFRGGLDRNQVFLIAQNSANNKFKDNRYHADLDLAKDVLRAERAVKRGGGADDIKSRILDARRLPGLAAERKAYIGTLVRDGLNQSGSFVATSDGQEWFIREDTGQPIPLTRANDSLNSILDIHYGLNDTEVEQKYVISMLIANTKERGQRGVIASLSHYDPAQNVLLVHTGRKDVFYVDAHNISTVSNGNLGVVFPWRPNEDAFDPDLTHGLSLDTLFSDCFENLDEQSPQAALALIKAWMYFLLFRDEAVARPILALFGQPGSGKSTLFRRIYAFLYGSSKAINSITDSDDFDHAVAYDPLVVFDNVDTFVSWLPDKLALSASTSDLVKRKLYTDADTIVLRRQALVGITAHNPKFRREDIVDRLLMLNFHRLEDFKSETTIIQDIIKTRDQLWGQFLLDAQRILASPKPSFEDAPKFRVADFARLGLWIARALGFEADFRAGLETNAVEQLAFNLEEEEILIAAVNAWLPHHKGGKFYTASELWTQWSSYAPDEMAFIRAYRNAVGLGKKLFALQETLRQMFDVEYEADAKQGTRVWKISPKGSST